MNAPRVIATCRAASLVAAWLGSSSLVCAQGNVLAVGPGRPFATIQAAIAAAQDGDVVEVDPGSHAPFAVVGKQLTVQAAGVAATFTVVGAPGISITGLQGNQCVTIANARVAATANGPGIAIQNAGGGNVRLLDVQVGGGNLGTVAFDGLIEVRDTDSLWLDRVRAGDYRWRTNGAGGGRGLAALFVDDTTVHATRCVLHGMRSDLPTIASGDAIAIVGPATLWTVDGTLVGGLPPANASGVHGGHAIQDLSGQAGEIRVCDTVLTTTDPNASAFAVMGAPAYLMACLPDGIARTELPLGTTAIALGGTAAFTVSADVPNRAFVLLLATGFAADSLPILEGDLLVDASAGIVAAGLLTTPQTLALLIPPQPLLTGLQCTAQAVLVDTPVWFRAATGAAFTIR